MGRDGARRRSLNAHGQATSGALVLAGLAAFGWIAAFYAVWVDAGHREEARAEIARLEAENALLRATVAPMSDLAVLNDAAPAVETTGVIRLAEARPVVVPAAPPPVRVADVDPEEIARRRLREEAERALEERVLALRDDIVRLERQVGTARRALSEAQEMRDAALAQADSERRARETILGEVESLDARARETRAALADLVGRLDTTRETLAETSERLAATRTALDEVLARREAVETALADAEARRDAAQSALSSAEERRVVAEQASLDADARRLAAEEALAAALARRDAIEAERERLAAASMPTAPQIGTDRSAEREDDIAAHTAEIAAREDEAARAGARVAEAEADLDAARAALAEIDGERDAAREALASLEAERDAARTALDALVAERDDAQNRLSALRDEIGAAEARLSARRAELARASAAPARGGPSRAEQPTVEIRPDGARVIRVTPTLR